MLLDMWRNCCIMVVKEAMVDGSVLCTGVDSSRIIVAEQHWLAWKESRSVEQVCCAEAVPASPRITASRSMAICTPSW